MRGPLRAFLVLLLLGSGVARAGESEELIWPRIAAGMSLVDEDHPATLEWAAEYSRHPQQLSLMLQRAEPFLWFIVEAVELRDIPLEVSLLPAIESGFDPHANSGQKARGLWQFVPATGGALGLYETRHYDARRDAVASTRAALGYLLKLERRFNDWKLALAAYNAGGNTVGRAIEKSGTRDYWKLELPPQTRDYVPRLLGLALVIREPQKFGITLPPIRNKHAAEIIVLKSSKDLERAARSAHVPEEILVRYNPGLKTLSNARGKTWVLLPPEEASRLRTELSLRQYKPRDEIELVVGEGDSLWRIARRYKVSVAELRSWNNLGPKTPLKSGRRIVVKTG